MARRVLAALVACLAVIFLGGTASAADDYPETGGVASKWECATAPATDPEAPAGSTLDKCRVTEWQPLPEALPYEAPTQSAVTVDAEQWSTLAGGLILLVLLGAALLTAQLRRR